MEIRRINKQDLEGIKAVLDSSELFPSDLLDDMIHDFLTNPNSEEVWLTTVAEGTPISMAYLAPERMTEGTYNLYAIAVDKSHQGKGIGGQLMDYIEDHLRGAGHRVIIVETSGLPDYELTRKFYHKKQYQEEAVIRDFYQEGEDKVVFWKKLRD